MLTEMDVAHALPSEGWIRRYVIHAMKQTTSPLCYHLGTGLTVLATTCPLQFGTHYAGGALRANLYTLLVGRSGEDQKSTALGIGRSLLHQAAAPLIGDYPGSPEGLIESLANANSQMIPISEFGSFLAQSQRGYMEPIKAMMADLWDCLPVQRARANNRTIRVDDPRLSMLAACSIPYLEAFTLSSDWQGGFMGRFLCLYGRRERIDPDPTGDDTDTEYLIEFLRSRASTGQAGWCEGLDPQAKKLWCDWYYELHQRRLPTLVAGVASRAPTIARKAAMLYSWDYGVASWGEPWQIGLAELEPAIKLAELHIKSLSGLADKIADHPDARLRRSVIGALDTLGGEAPLGQILRILKMKKRSVVESLDGLVEEGRIRRIRNEMGSVYVLSGVF
jgi:hypothetical protein